MSYEMDINIDKIMASSRGDAIIIIDNMGKIVFWNEAAARMLLYTAQEALKNDLYELIVPMRYKAQYKQAFQYVTSAGIEAAVYKKLELSAIRQDQTEFAGELSFFSAKIEDKECTICLLRDISSLKRGEQALQCAKEQLENRVAELTQELETVHQKLAAVQQEVIYANRKLDGIIREKEQEIEVRHRVEQDLLIKTEELERFFWLTGDLLCFVDKQGCFIRVNRVFELTLGYAAAELMDRPFLDFVHPDDRLSTKNAFADVLDGRVASSFCNRYQCKKGNYRWFEWTSLIDTATGVVYATARDITDRKKAEDELRKKNQEIILARRKAEKSWRYLNNALQNIDAVIWQLDKNGVFTLYEGQGLKKLNRKPGQNVGLSIFKLYKDYPKILRAMERSLQGHPTQTEIEYQNLICSIICTTLFDAAGNVDGVVGIMIDRTKQRDWERRLQLIQENHRRSVDINEILTRTHSKKEQNRRLSNYGIDCGKPIICHLISVTRNKKSGNLPNSKEDVMEWLVNNGYIWSWYSSHGVGVLIQNHAAVLENEDGQKAQAQALRVALHKQFPEILIRIGIASTETGILNLPSLYYKAYAALLLSMDDKEESRVFHYKESGIYQIFPLMLEYMEVDEFIQQFLGGLIQYETEKSGDLLATLGAILASANLKTVALELHVHHNTILWRKNKIEEILGYTLDDANRRIHLAAAIKLRKIREVMQKEI